MYSSDMRNGGVKGVGEPVFCYASCASNLNVILREKRLVGIVRLRTKTTEFSLVLLREKCLCCLLFTEIFML
jgi:hypothetical protein